VAQPAQHDNAPNKPVHLIYLVGAIILFYVLQWCIDWIWGYFGRVPNETYISVAAAVLAAIIGVVLYRSDRYYHLANEVASELKKVTWPNAKQVRIATLIVIATTIVSALILGLFDFIWSQVTELVYG
jgi:preprotein translocase subunit SecE